MFEELKCFNVAIFSMYSTITYIENTFVSWKRDIRQLFAQKAIIGSFSDPFSVLFPSSILLLCTAWVKGIQGLVMGRNHEPLSCPLLHYTLIFTFTLQMMLSLFHTVPVDHTKHIVDIIRILSETHKTTLILCVFDIMYYPVPLNQYSCVISCKCLSNVCSVLWWNVCLPKEW